MRKYAVCPICQARIFPGNSNITPREELENHLHNEEARTWVQARQMAKDSTIILEDDMATKTKEAREETRIQEISDKIAKLENLSESLKSLENRLSSLENQTQKETGSSGSVGTASSIATETRKDTGEVELRDQKMAEMEARIAHLESPEHRDNLILEWLHTLDQESYYALGVRKGYLEEINSEKPAAPGELRDPSPEVIFSQEKPEDLTGWIRASFLKDWYLIFFQGTFTHSLTTLYDRTRLNSKSKTDSRIKRRINGKLPGMMGISIPQ